MKVWDEVSQRPSRRKSPRETTSCVESNHKLYFDIVHWLSEGKQGMKQAEPRLPGVGVGPSV